MGPRHDSERPILEFVDSMWGVDNDWCRYSVDYSVK